MALHNIEIDEKVGDWEGGREGINPKEGRIGYGDGNKKHSNVRIVIVSSKSSTFYTGARDTISVSAQIFLGVPVVKRPLWASLVISSSC